MNSLSTANGLVWGLFALLLLLLLLYLIIMPKYTDVIESKKVSSTLKIINSDQVYYLPVANILISATAKVAVTKRLADQTIINAEVYEISFENQVQIEADEKQMYSLHYKPNWFSADDIKLVTSPLGLLENLSVTAEDRFSQTLFQIASIPQKAPATSKPAEAAAQTQAIAPEPLTTVTNLLPVTKSFVLYADMLSKAEHIFDWKISAEGNHEDTPRYADASFKVKVSKPIDKTTAQEPEEPIKGILTRPLGKADLAFHMKTVGSSNDLFEEQPAFRYQAMVPDTSKLVMVSCQRRLFSKYMQTQKFSSGMLTENDMSKPSEAESLMSIPITMGKAILSVPAQLLSFKITKIQQQTSYEAAIQKLIAAQLANKTPQKTKKGK